MKRTYTGWLSRDERGDLFLGQYKPNCDCGYWVNMGENIQLPDCDFQEVTFENSPREVIVTIEDAPKYKEVYTVDSRLSQVIADLPCIVEIYKGWANPNRYYYMFQWSGFKTLVEDGDVIALKENGEWVVLSEFYAED